MSSSSDPMSERFLCSICLEVFSNPVSTPCGHNFCKICLNTHWDNSEDYRCPNCEETFNQRPDLKINTTLRELVDEHKKKSHEEQPEAEVVCDICTEGKLKAVKSCLVCQSSYCETHLESHLRVSGLQKHKLIDPVKNLQDYICQKHYRPLELFCRDDHTCLCLFCTERDHKNHNTVPLRESELKEMMKERQRAAEKQKEDVIKDLKEEITELKKRNIEQQQKISNTEDDLLLIQEKHQNDLSRQQKSSSEHSYKFWFLVVGVLFVLLSYKDIQHRESEITELKKRNNEMDLDIQRREAETLERLQLSKTIITELKERIKVLDLHLRRCEADLGILKERKCYLFLMSSFSDQMTERLLCSICLDVFSDPVSTPCGHNFCKICLNTYWNNSEDYRCPNCNKTLDQRPDLKINTTLRELVDEHKKKFEVVCDICTEGKLKAVKSCLVCQSSYCETHLESHLRVSGLQKHKLIDPVKNLQDYICQKHDRPLGLFCRDDQTCVCVICTVTDHKNHNTVHIRESELQEMMEEKQRATEKHDVIKDLEQEITELKKRNIELEMIAENQRAAETQDKSLIKDLKKEITELRMRNIELEMKVEMQKASEDRYEGVIKHMNQEIKELRKTNVELMEMMEEKQRDEDLIKDLNEEISALKRRNHELAMIAEEQRATETQNKHLIKELEQNIKRRNNDLEMTRKNWRAAEKMDKDVIKNLQSKITQLNMKDIELKMLKQKQITEKRQYENVITVRDQEMTELKKKNIAQQQKISHTENCIRILQEDLSSQKRSSFKDLRLSTVIGFILVVLLLFATGRLELLQKEITELKKRDCDLETDIIRCKAELKLMQQYAVDVTLDPDTANPYLILSDDEKQVRTGGIMHDLPDNPKGFDACRNVLEKEGFSSGRFYKFLVVGLVLFVVSAYCIQAHKDTQRHQAVLKWMQQYAVDVTLDLDTAHPLLFLSDDEKQVRTGEIKNKLPDSSKRFNVGVIVLGKEGFSSGRFYYEVQVKGKTEWTLGVVRESVDRKGEITLTPVNGFWTVALRNENEYKAFADPDVSLSLSVEPQKVGVFVDYEEGLISFYDVENRSHIYSYTDQSFTEKLYPYFSPSLNDEGKNSEPLIIRSVN
ncbi:centrosomal protein of 290 kDa-like [Triplophysa dalaica]|uniref:centrosomal protein of 290 kDa-like n=1 Tax=Triplophysa dalaica TaxID=1582913 RepID=UPI0024DF8141|nr:centrosomal protein of 290 kDa-like [Triplophysa dalaica]